MAHDSVFYHSDDLDNLMGIFPDIDTQSLYVVLRDTVDAGGGLSETVSALLEHDDTQQRSVPRGMGAISTSTVTSGTGMEGSSCGVGGVEEEGRGGGGGGGGGGYFEKEENDPAKVKRSRSNNLTCAAVQVQGGQFMKAEKKISDNNFIVRILHKFESLILQCNTCCLVCEDKVENIGIRAVGMNVQIKKTN